MSVFVRLFIGMPSRFADKVIMALSRNNQGQSALFREYFEKRYKVSVGEFSYGGCFNSLFNQGGTVIIGRYCSIAGNVHYFGANHPMESVSTSAYFYNRNMSGYEVKDVTRSVLRIQNDVWIGYGTIITNGCETIGTGAVIGAGSVVTHNVPAYAVVAGNPAKILRYRNTEETNNALVSSKWWEHDLKDIMKYYKYMDTPETFAELINHDTNQ